MSKRFLLARCEWPRHFEAHFLRSSLPAPPMAPRGAQMSPQLIIRSPLWICHCYVNDQHEWRTTWHTLSAPWRADMPYKNCRHLGILWLVEPRKNKPRPERWWFFFAVENVHKEHTASCRHSLSMTLKFVINEPPGKKITTTDLFFVFLQRTKGCAV